MPSVPALSNQFNAAKGRALVMAQSRLVAIAKNRHAAVMGREPRPTGFLRIVDGHLGAAEEAVKVFGIIHYIYNRSQIGFELNPKETIARLDEIAQFALQTLRASSTVGSKDDPHPGLYRESHKLFLNGYPVDDLSGWKDGSEISITNYVEYSRILEIGDGSFRLPHFTYENAANVVAEKYGRDAKIEFTWRGLTDGYQIAQAQKDQRGFGVKIAARKRQHNVSAHRFPTIVITPIVSRFGQLVNLAGNVISIAGSVAEIRSAFSAGYSTQSRPLMLNAPGTIDHR